MVFKLYDGAWDDIIEGLELRAEWLAEDPHWQDKANLVRDLLKDFERLGAEILGGKIEGYRLTANSGNALNRVVEIRVVDHCDVEQRP